jgi:uncharacterized protein (DUF1919 family)
MLHDLGKPFLTPTINLHFNPCDFVKFLRNIHFYLDQPLVECVKEMYPYPVGKLFDINVYFVHYHSFEEASLKWNRRKKRINFDNLFIIMTDRHAAGDTAPLPVPCSCSYEVLQEFDSLPFVNKICFTHKELKSCFYLKEESKKECVGVLALKVNILEKRGYQQLRFDYVGWLNGTFKGSGGLNNTPNLLQE